MAIRVKDGDKINFDKGTISRDGKTVSIKDYKSGGDKSFSSSKKKSSSGRGSSSNQVKTINASLSWDGNISTISETVGEKTTTTITDKRTGKSVTKSGSSSYNDLSRQEKESISPTSKPLDVEALRKKLQEEQKTQGLRAKVVDIKTGRVIVQGNFKVNRDFERRLSSFERSYGKLNPTQKINLATYEQLLKVKADPKSKDIKDLLKVNSIVRNEEELLRNLKTSRQSMNPQEIKRYYQIQEERLNQKNFNLPNIKESRLGDFNNWLEDQRQKAIKGDKNARASLIGVSSLPTNLVESGGALIIRLAESTLNPEATLRAISSLTKKDIQDGGARFGARLQKGDPSALTDVVVELSPLRFGRVKNINEIDDVVRSNTNDLNKINSRIKNLENQGTNIRQRTLEAKELRELKETKKVLESDLKDLDSIIRVRDKPAITQKQKNEQVKEVKKVVNNFKKRNSKRSKQEKTLEEFEKERLAQNKESKKKTSEGSQLRKEAKLVSDEIIIKTIKDNFKNPTKLKQLKKILKGERNLNVKILQTEKGLKVILKEGGNNAKKGVKTAKTDKTYLITEKGQLVRLDKQRKGTKAVEDPLNAREKKKFEKNLEFEKGQNLDKVINDLRRHENKRSSLLSNKKGQVQLFRSTGKAYKKVEKTTKERIAKTKKFIDDYRARVQKANKQNKELTRRGKKSKDFSKSERENFTKQKKSLDKELKDSIKEVKAFRKSLDQLVKLVPALALASKSLQGSLAKQESILLKAQDVLQKQELKTDNVQDNVNKNKGSQNGKGKGSGDGKKSGGSSSSTKNSPKSNPKGKPTPKPKPDPKIKPIPKLKLSSKEKGKVKFSKVTTKGEIIYTNEKGNKVKLKTGLPYDWAYKVALETVDESLLGSTRVRKYGKVKAREGLRFDNELLKKFRDKKSKNPRVNEIVEKAKHRLDTKSEVSSIESKKILASKLKIAKETIKELKKARLKESRGKTTKKIKKSLKSALKSKKKGGKR